MSLRIHSVGLFTTLLTISINAQAILPVAAVAPPAPVTITYDAQELVTTAPQNASTEADRAAAVTLLDRARQNLSLVALGNPMYDLKISFTAQGQGPYAGPGDMEEMRNTNGVRRWTAHLGTYSVTQIISGSQGINTGSVGPTPMRIQMIRSILLGPIANIDSAASIRTAKVSYSGANLTCILTGPLPSSVLGRDWHEIEHCVDPLTGFLRILSPAPGLYSIFDYQNPQSYHGATLPGAITTYVAGTIVLQQTLTLQEPGTLDPSLFTPQVVQLLPTAQTTTVVTSSVTPEYFQETRPKKSVPDSSTVKPVIIHAMLSADGHVIEPEALQMSDTALSQAVLDFVKTRNFGASGKASGRNASEVFIQVD